MTNPTANPSAVDAAVTRPIPKPSGKVALAALQAWWRGKSPFAAIEAFHQQMGPVFRANLPTFKPIMTAGAEWARFILVEAREQFLWKNPKDPIARLLREGLLVADGETHDLMHRAMFPALHKKAITGYLDSMTRITDQAIQSWCDGKVHDMLPEMRRIAMLIVMETLFSVDFAPLIADYWASLLRLLKYVSPGMWVIWSDIPRPGYARHIQQMNAYLYQIIHLRREHLAKHGGQPHDLLALLIEAGADDAMIRDQILTMIIAGHDTSTGLLAWAMYMLGVDRDNAARAREEVDAVLGGSAPNMEKISELHFLSRFVDETLRLYPPAHLGSRLAAVDMSFQGYPIHAGERVTYSIYVTHRMAEYWPNPTQFAPDRFLEKPVPYSFLPFGGGKRNCIGSTFAEIEAKVILARVLQQIQLELVQPHVHMHMAVTLEPRPGVLMRVQRR
ncbi:MAG: cytochrome P450 [Anaerolineae bacterium]